MTDAIDLTTEQRKTLNDLLRRFLPGVAVWAYGSRVKWTARPNSDLDLVAFTTPAQRTQVADLKDALAESNLPFPVDLHLWDDVPERFREIILKEYVVVQEAKQPEGKASKLSEWREVSVDEIKAPSENALATGPFGSSIGSRFFQATGIPVIRGSNLSEDIGTRLNDEGLVFLTPDKAQEFSRSTVREGDLVFTCWGTVNQIGLIDGRAAYREYVISNKQMKLTPDPAKADSLFLYYLFSSPDLQDRIKNEAIGSSVPGFNLGQLRAMRLVIPEPGEQRAIAHILGTLDDKIELNRRMNETLEAMARALFKSWFVDFDPVRAKAEGRDTGLPKHLADLFPDSFEDSELGRIPRRWQVESLDQIAYVVMGLSPDGDTYNTQALGIPLINGPVEFGDYYPVKAKWTTSPARVTQAGDLVLCVRGSTTGRRVIADSVYCLGRGVCAIRTKNETRIFICQTVNANLERLLSKTTGSVFPNLGAPDIKSFPVLVPERRVMETFERLVTPLIVRLEGNIKASHALAALRDTLLPKLISGELRVGSETRIPSYIETGNSLLRMEAGNEVN